MANLRELSVNLLDWEARYIIESLSRELDRLKSVAGSSDEEDLAADVGNDYLELAGLKERLEGEAKAVFGNQIVDFGT